ncbi:class II fructose-bisphosphate aldolase, partial [Escherichia coli]
MSKIFDFVKPGVITGDDVQKVRAPVIIQFSNGGASFIAGKGL